MTAGLDCLDALLTGHTLLLTRSSNLNHIYRPLSVQERNGETCEADVPARGVGDSLHTHQCKNDT